MLYHPGDKETDRLLLEVWRTWANTLKPIDDIDRAGFPACGTGRWQPRQKWIRKSRNSLVKLLQKALAGVGVVRNETDGGHIYGLHALADLLYRYFPEHFPEDSQLELYAGIQFHEIDELENGDSLDDGRQDISKKVAEMSKDFDRLLGHLPNVESIKVLLIESELSKGLPYAAVDKTNRIAVLAWILKALDKVEAILQNGRYRQMGVVGHVSQKEDPSERDLWVVQKIGTDDVTLTWAYASKTFLEGTILWRLILVMINDVYSPEEIPEVFRITPD